MATTKAKLKGLLHLGRNPRNEEEDTVCIPPNPSTSPHAALPDEFLSRSEPVRSLSKHAGGDNARPLTVIELFQSQGCSSCPPANDNVIRLADNPDTLILTYEVTYWDYLGWPDTFGSKAWDDRQRDYSAAFKSRNVYTPQVRPP